MTDEQSHPSRPIDPFEQELKRVLSDEAAAAAPERLVARIASIPGSARPGVVRAGGGRGRLGARFAALPASRFGLGLAAVAAVAVAIVAGSLLLGGFAPRSNVGSPPSGPIAGSPSAGAVGPAPTAASPSSGPIGGPIPADFQPASASFTSADDGWVLGTATCAGAPCASIVRTTDGGRAWSSLPAPDAAVAAGGSGTAGVRGLRFADALNGWAFGPDLWATHDGGATWSPVSLPGSSTDRQVMTLETASGVVHAVYFDGGATGTLTIATSPVGTDDWVRSPTTVELGAGPVPNPQLVLSGTAGWLIEVDRVVVDGSRLIAGAWTPWQPPCAAGEGPARLAASSPSDLVTACDVGLWSTPAGVHLYASSDGGATFTEVASTVPVSSIEEVAAPAPGTVLVAGGLAAGGSAIVGLFDGGTTWTQVQAFQGARSTGLAFTTAQDGFAIGPSGDGTSELLITRDGGRTWSVAPITGG
jgi:hypothetical protein